MRTQSQSKTTTDHSEIREWVETRGGHPACVRGTGNRGDIGLLRIDYPGYSGKQTLQKISWDEFFGKFDERHLAFVYQDKPESRFSKLVDAVEEPMPRKRAAATSKKATAKKATAKKAAKMATDHEEIREWVERRGGHPACVKGTGGKSDPGMLRIDYPGYSGEDTLASLSWDKWFKGFEANKLAFLYQDTPRSRFSKLVERSAKKTAAKKG